MVRSICLLTWALAVGQAPDRTEWLLAPQLAPGLELVYQGSYTEEALIPNVQYQQQYRLETQVLVLDAGKRTWDVAIMTSLALRDPKQEKAPKDGVKPSSVRLERFQVDQQGRLKGLSGASPLAPLQGPPTVECGLFVEAPLTKVAKTSFWPVTEDGRPTRTWTLCGIENCGGAGCLKLSAEQQSDDWDQPRADRTGWRRRDTVWFNTQLGVAHKVERVIERRDPARRAPTHRATVRYELESRMKYSGKLFEDRRNEIVQAIKYQEEARPLLAQPAQYGHQIDGLIGKLKFFADNQPPTPYRKTITQLQSRLDKARKGEIIPTAHVDDPPPTSTAVGIGQKVPDFVVTDLMSRQSTRLNGFAGKPVLVFFYSPSTATGKEVLQFAKDLADRHNGKLGILALAASDNEQLIRKQHDELQLPFGIHDGKGLRLTFGVEATPRLVLLDADHVVRTAHTGWGFHTPREIAEELERILRK